MKIIKGGMFMKTTVEKCKSVMYYHQEVPLPFPLTYNI